MTDRLTLRRRALLLLAAIAVPAFAAPKPSAPPADDLAMAIKAHISFLADDALEGRGLGQRGHEIAAKYVAAEFARLGLAPAGTDGWFQRIGFAESRFSSATETMAFANGSDTATWINNADLAMAPGGAAGAESFSAPLVFVGFGLQDPGLGIDDFKGLDLKGKIAVALAGAPPGMNSETAAHLARTSKASGALAAGAIGLIQVRTLVEAARLPWEKAASRARQPRRILLGPDGQPLGDGAGLRLRASVDDKAAALIFAGSGQSFDDVRVAAAKGPVRGFALPGRVTVDRAQSITRVTSPNVIGLLPGTSTRLATEIVLISAHLDHLGLLTAEANRQPDPKAPPADMIFNGAMDNASGVATLLTTARSLATARKRPQRSVMFLVTTGEESGLLGADYFARNPTVPLARVVAAVNIDMPILTCDFGDIVPFGAERSTMAIAVRAAARAENLSVSPDPQPEEAVFTRSDHYPLVRAGIPAVFLKTGWKDARGGMACKDAERAFRLTQYHELSDNLSLPFDWAAAAKFGRLNTGIIRRLADAPAAPRWYAADYFGDSFAPDAPKATRPRAAP